MASFSTLSGSFELEAPIVRHSPQAHHLAFSTLSGSFELEADARVAWAGGLLTPFLFIKRLLAHYNDFFLFVYPHIGLDGGGRFATPFLFKNGGELRKCLRLSAPGLHLTKKMQQGGRERILSHFWGELRTGVKKKPIFRGCLQYTNDNPAPQTTSLQKRRNSQVTHGPSLAGGMGITSPAMVAWIAAIVVSTFCRRLGVIGIASACRWGI